MKIKNLLILAALVGIISMSNCISFTSTGLANQEKQPDKEWVGQNYNQLVNQYGAPERMSRNGNRPEILSEAIKAPTTENNTNSSLAVYKSLESSTWIIYHKLKEYSYTFKIENNKITDFTKILSKKANGISFNIPSIGSSSGPNTSSGSKP